MLVPPGSLWRVTNSFSCWADDPARYTTDNIPILFRPNRLLTAIEHVPGKKHDWIKVMSDRGNFAWINETLFDMEGLMERAR